MKTTITIEHDGKVQTFEADKHGIYDLTYKHVICQKNGIIKLVGSLNSGL